MTLMEFAAQLFPLPRSMTGQGNRETLRLIQQRIPLQIHEIPSGTKVFDWTVPPEWTPRGPVVVGKDGRGICERPEDNAYNPHGSLTYGTLYVSGETQSEVLISTYICHPLQAQDGVSGMVVATALAEWVLRDKRRYSYRFAFVPETLGALCFMHDVGVELLRARCLAAFVLTCCGRETGFTAQESRAAGTLADRVAWAALWPDPPNIRDWHERGSDERQYGAPNIDLPVISIMRGAHHSTDFPEYHAQQSDFPIREPIDTLDKISEAGLQGSLDVHIRCLEVLEANATYRVTSIGEPHLGPCGLYTKEARQLCGYSDGRTDLLAISEQTGLDFFALADTAKQLEEAGFLIPA